jgi:hypothetical protein
MFKSTPAELNLVTMYVDWSMLTRWFQGWPLSNQIGPSSWAQIKAGSDFWRAISDSDLVLHDRQESFPFNSGIQQNFADMASMKRVCLVSFHSRDSSWQFPSGHVPLRTFRSWGGAHSFKVWNLFFINQAEEVLTFSVYISQMSTWR